jgi:hypothetical protein
VIQNNRKKKENEKVVVKIYNTRFLIESDNDSVIKEKIEKIVEEHSKDDKS